MAFGSFFGSQWATVFGSKFGELLFGSEPQTTLTVAISDTADPVISLANFTQSIVVTNTGAIDANNVECTITLDGAVTYVSCAGTDWTCVESGGVVTCTRATLAPGAAPTLTLTTTSPGADDTLTTLGDAVADNAPAATQDSETTTVLHIPKDATSGKRVPLSQVDWDNTFTLAGVSGSTLSHSYGFQDASGGAAATVGTNATATGTQGYNTAVAGWTRTGIQISETASERQALAAGVAPNCATGSGLQIVYAKLDATPGGTRRLMFMAPGTTNVDARMTSTPRIVVGCVNVTATGGSDPGTANVRPYVLRYDKTNSIVALYTDQEVLAGTYNSGAVDGEKGFGATSGQTSAPMTYLMGALFAGANAEWSQAKVKAVLQILGWTIPW